MCSLTACVVCVACAGVSTVLVEDPTALVVMSSVLMDELYAGIRNRSSRVVAAITDHTGMAHVMIGSGCNLTNSDLLLSRCALPAVCGFFIPFVVFCLCRLAWCKHGCCGADACSSNVGPGRAMFG